MDIDTLEIKLVQYADGQLSDQEAEALDKILQHSPQLMDELELYKSSPKVDEFCLETMPDKQSLVRHQKGWICWAAAACVAGILAISFGIMETRTPFTSSEGGSVVAQLESNEIPLEAYTPKMISRDSTAINSGKSYQETRICTTEPIHDTMISMATPLVLEKSAADGSEKEVIEVYVEDFIEESSLQKGVVVAQVVIDTQRVCVNGLITYQESACNTMLCKASEWMKILTKEIKQVPADFINKNFIN